MFDVREHSVRECGRGENVEEEFYVECDLGSSLGRDSERRDLPRCVWHVLWADIFDRGTGTCVV